MLLSSFKVGFTWRVLEASNYSHGHGLCTTRTHQHLEPAGKYLLAFLPPLLCMKWSRTSEHLLLVPVLITTITSANGSTTNSPVTVYIVNLQSAM